MESGGLGNANLARVFNRRDVKALRPSDLIPMLHCSCSWHVEELRCIPTQRQMSPVLTLSDSSQYSWITLRERDSAGVPSINVFVGKRGIWIWKAFPPFLCYSLQVSGTYLE
jgi:hypothetical protein